MSLGPGCFSREEVRPWGRNELVTVLTIIVAVVLVWPFGAYAILNDWAYVKSLEHLHVDGQLKILDILPMSTIGHLLWGVIFTKLFGFSFTATKVSVLVLCVVESLTLLRLLALCGVGKNLAMVATLGMIFNPLHFIHATTFMTDVPALAWQIISVYCYLRGVLAAVNRHNSAVNRGFWREGLWLAAGSVASGEASLVRQSGLLVPAALFLSLILFHRRLLRPGPLVCAFGPVLLIVLAFSYWYQYLHGPTRFNARRVQEIIDFVAHPPWEHIPFIAFSYFVYTGWFLIALAASVPFRTYRWQSKVGCSIFLGLSITAFNAFIYFANERGKVFPYIWNVMTPFGLFSPDELVIGPRELLWGNSVGVLIAAASLAAAFAMLQRLICPARPVFSGTSPSFSLGPEEPSAETKMPVKSPGKATVMAGNLLVILLVLQLLYMLATAPFVFDRHLLLVAPTVTILFCLGACHGTDVNLVRSLACVVPFAAYSVATTHDVHSLSRLAFQAGDGMIAEGIDPRYIDGGYAFVNWSIYQKFQTRDDNHSFPPWWLADLWGGTSDYPPGTSGWSLAWPPRTWWFRAVSTGVEPKVAVTLGVPANARSRQFQISRQYSYQNWWPWKVNTVCVVSEPED